MFIKMYQEIYNFECLNCGTINLELESQSLIKFYQTKINLKEKIKRQNINKFTYEYVKEAIKNRQYKDVMCLDHINNSITIHFGIYNIGITFEPRIISVEILDNNLEKQIKYINHLQIKINELNNFIDNIENHHQEYIDNTFRFEEPFKYDLTFKPNIRIENNKISNEQEDLLIYTKYLQNKFIELINFIKELRNQHKKYIDYTFRWEEPFPII